MARPATATGTKYNQVSNAFCEHRARVLTKKQDPEAAVADLHAQLARVKGRSW